MQKVSIQTHLDVFPYLRLNQTVFPVNGCRKLVQLTKLTESNFMDRNGEFQLEVHLSNIRSVFEHKFRINQSIFNNLSKLGKLETSYFSFDQYDWNLSIYPSGRSDSQLGTFSVGNMRVSQRVFNFRDILLDFKPKLVA